MRKHLLLACSLLALGACSKKEDAAPSRAALLTARPWRITAFTTAVTPSGGTTTTTDEYAAMPACTRDDFTKFNTDNTLTVDEGASKCGPNSAQSQAFSWSLLNNDTQLRVANPNNTSPETDAILELSATTLRLQLTTTSSDRIKVETVTFTAF